MGLLQSVTIISNSRATNDILVLRNQMESMVHLTERLFTYVPYAAGQTCTGDLREGTIETPSS